MMYSLRSLSVLVFRSIKPLKSYVTCKTEIKSQPILNYSISKLFSQKVMNENEDPEIIISTLCNSDPDIEKKLRILMLEVEVMRQDGRQAPDRMLVQNWKHLMELPSRSQRSNYLLYLWKTEKSRQNEKMRKEAKRKEIEEHGLPEVQKEFPDDLVYSISQQSLFLRIRDQSINNFDNYRALQALKYGQKVVIDCSYEKYMVLREAVNAAKQATFVFGDNRIHQDPFNLYLCNVQMQSNFMKQMRKNIPSIEEPWFPLNIHQESYLDLFPKDKLVYLTPHCRNELTEFDHDAVYIIGCMVDKINNEPLSLAKAKRDGLKMAKLPLDRYLEWAPGAKKNLNINHMVPILLDLKSTGDWEYALRHIPRRKLLETKLSEMQYKIKKFGVKKEILKPYQNLPNIRKLVFSEKRNKSKKSLYKDDDNIY